MKHWWKILGVVLIGYSLIAGMLVPIGSGITSSAPNVVHEGDQVTIDIFGYNTFFREQSENIIILRSEGHHLMAQSVTPISDQHIRAEFRIPNRRSGFVKQASIIVNNQRDGFAIQPDAVFIRAREDEKKVVDSEWIEGLPDAFIQSESFHFPYRAILLESIRNTYYHVPLWFAMILLMAISAFEAFRLLRQPQSNFDNRSKAFAEVGFFIGILGLVTGMIWAKNTWGAYWSWDIKQNTTAICLLIYAAYFILRSSISDPDSAARIGAIYNLFAFAMLVPLLYIIPRMTESLHPGSGGNPAMGGEDLDNTMRMVFYPAVVGWMLFSYWIAQLVFRIYRLQSSNENQLFE